MSKPSKDVLDKLKTKDGHVDVMIDGILVSLPQPVALWLRRIFHDDDLHQHQRDLWEWMMKNPLPKPQT